MSKIAEVEFTLTQEEMQQMLGMANFNRYRHRHAAQSGALRVQFSAMLSPEGQLAMSQAWQDTKSLIKQIAVHGDTIKHRETTGDRQREKAPVPADMCGVPPRKEDQRARSAGLLEVFERLGTPRMTEDLTADTDEDFTSSFNARVRSLDGTKKQNSMEIVEIIDYDKSQYQGFDDAAIEEIAKRNSVEKCKVWIEAHTDNDTILNGDSQNDLAGED